MENFDTRGSYNKTTDTDVKYTGQSFPELNIKSGDSLTKVISNLITAAKSIQEISKRIDEVEASLTVNSGQVTANSLLYDLVDQSSAVTSGLNDKNIKLDVIGIDTAGSKVDFAFDMNEVFDNLDSKYVPIIVDTSVRTYDGSNRILASSSSRSGTLSVSKTTGPYIVTSRANFKSPDGDIVLTKAFYVPTSDPTSMEGKPSVSGTETSEAKDYSQKEYNEVLASNISKLTKEIANLQKKLTTIKKQA